MEALCSTDIFVFEGFRLDRSGLFRRCEDAALRPIDIGSRALEVLQVLLRRPGELVLRHEIMAAAWPRMVVGDNNLNVQISTLRRVLDQDRASGSCIQTIPGRGYRFVAAVKRVEASPHSAIQIVSHGGEPSPRRLSIIVLPFANVGDDPEEHPNLVNGITEDLTTDLSRLDSMLVTSRNTALAYRNTSVDSRRIGRELGVRYVLNGSVQQSGNQVRVTARLIDAATDVQLWAERFDHGIGDLLALQNEITGRIANALGLELIAAEAARPTENPDAPDYILRGRAVGLRPSSRDTHARRIAMFEHALALDPRSTEAQSLLADALAHRVLDRLTDAAAADMARAETLVDRALAASPRSPTAHLAKAIVLRALDQCEEAIPECETALAINPNSASALDNLADCKLLTGSLEDAISLAQQAIRLSPRDPRIGYFYIRIGHAHLLQSCPDKAIPWLERARGAVPEIPFVHALLGSAHGLKGDIGPAAAELAKARRLSADNRWSSVAHWKAVGYFGVPKVRTLMEATYIAGLRRAGMPEE
jgi:TolB-like protein/Tfp pilus assembly protein PilF